MLLDEAPQIGHSRVAAENDLAPNVESTFHLGWSSESLPVDLRLYNEFNIFSVLLSGPIRSNLTSTYLYYSHRFKLLLVKAYGDRNSSQSRVVKVLF